MGVEPHISAIISEYNPFHCGHQYHIDQTRKMGSTHIVAIMSGNFSQRGTPAILSKWARTKSALLCGVDLVLELPVPWAVASAEKFAYGAVFIADALGCVNTLSFGSECGNLASLQKAANIAVASDIQSDIRTFLQSGICYAAAREKAINQNYGSRVSSLFQTPNNILAIEYIKALNQLRSRITPYTIARIGAEHDSAKIFEGIASASYLREIILSSKADYQTLEKLMPPSSAEILKEEICNETAPADIRYVERAILAKLRSMSRSEFAVLPDVSEGLENRIYDAVRTSVSLEDLFFKVKTKRYTLSRIRRIILAAFLKIENFNNPAYIRVLGFNNKGIEILRQAKATATLPIVMRAADISTLEETALKLFALEGRASDLYSLALPTIKPCGLEMTTGTIRI